jgi:hypothetical protein
VVMKSRADCSVGCLGGVVAGLSFHQRRDMYDLLQSPWLAQDKDYGIGFPSKYPEAIQIGRRVN